MTFKVAVFGEALFDMIEQENGDYRPFIGGSPYNVARSFSRQGLDCSYLSPISNDIFGDKIYKSAVEEGIDIPANNRSFQATSLALVYKNSQGNSDYRLYRKSVADLDINAQKLLDNLPKDLDLFHTGSLALVPEMVDVLIPVMIALKANGVKISIDVNVRKGVEINHAKYIAAIAQLVTYADIVKVSDEDLLLQNLVGDPEHLASAMLKNMTNGMVVLTLGENGAHFITENMNIQQDVFRAVPMGDTVGAGDTFFSAMLAQLLRDNALTPAAKPEDLAYALKFGALAAAINVSKIGCHPPTFEEVLKNLAPN
ncbi:carbohydrate kinase [Colwellia sp. M166]|uniref:carbohydrate kinase family protein n=1 Tax=Colwellia sp. M166 TaxID=2583805 RepID=UPI00211EF93E|nr:carbohydrate kinase [Colwellia sp. M166]UUO25352.1 carbohydrate kinase [Colwellia sp. M166]|tara:strand:+ start:26092 stop:27030 length:939 start_codon:yes stop_codon:yes gene_type:complete